MFFSKNISDVNKRISDIEKRQDIIESNLNLIKEILFLLKNEGNVANDEFIEIKRRIAKMTGREH